MTISLKHTTQSTGGPYTPTGELGPTQWNEEHTLTQATSRILGRVTASTGPTEELTAAQVRTLINVADGATANTGDVTAASTFGTDNVMVRSDGTGKGVQSTGITVGDDNKVAIIAAGVTHPGATFQLEIHGAAGSTSGVSLRSEVTSAVAGGQIRLFHNNASNALPGSSDRLGGLFWGSFDGATARNAAFVGSYAEAAWTTGTSIPARISFETVPTGSTTRAERLVIKGDGVVRPGADNAQTFGDGSFRWSAIHAANGTIQTSDERDKIVLGDLPFAGQMVDTIDPILFKWTVGKNILVPSETETVLDDDGNEVPKLVPQPVPGMRVHAGFSAQKLKEAMDGAGQDFGAWGLDDKDDPDSRQWVRPDQLVPVLWAALKETRKALAALEKKIAKKR